MGGRVQLKHLRVEGEPETLGQNHGEELREEIAKSLELYRVWFQEVGGLDWEQVLLQASSFIPELQAGAPELLLEMQGIAAGARVPLEAIVALNSRTEIAYGCSGVLSSGRGASGESAIAECTAAGISSSAAVDGHTYIGQNWDWRHTHLEITVLLTIVKPGAPRLLTLTEAGMVGKLGLNAAGLGLCFNLLATSRNQLGLPAHVLARQVLEQWRLDRALQVVIRAQRAGAGNFLLGYYDLQAGAGEVANLEWAATDFNVTFPDCGYVVRTNHFLQPIAGAVDRIKFFKAAGLSTYIRLARARHLLAQFAAEGRLGRESLETVFRDHYNYPRAICSHPVPEEGELSQSNVSVIMDLTEGTLAYTGGPPCRATYRYLRV